MNEAGARKTPAWQARSEWAPYAVLALLSAPLILFGLDRYSLVNGDEEIYHVVARTMVEQGDWIRLQFYDEHRVYDTFMNAPLQYWFRAAAISLLGDSLFSMRILTALFAVASVLMTCRLARVVSGRPEVGLLAGLVQLTTLQFVYLHGARTGELEPVVLLLYTAIALQFVRGVEAGRGSFVLHHLCLALLFNVKAPTLLIPLLAEAACFALLPATRPALGRFVRSAFWILPWAATWHVARMVALYEPFLAVMNEMAGQAAAHGRETTTDGRLATLGFYLRTVLFGAFPWSIVMPFALWHGLRTRDAQRAEAVQRWVILALFIAAVFVFYGLVSKHHRWYIMPAYPLLAVFIARWLADLPRIPWTPARITSIAVVITGVLIARVNLAFNPFVMKSYLIPMNTYWREPFGLSPLVAAPLLALALAFGLHQAGPRMSARTRTATMTLLAVSLLLFAGHRVARPLAYIDHQSEMALLRAELDRLEAEGALPPAPIEPSIALTWDARFHLADRYEITPKPDGRFELTPSPQREAIRPDSPSRIKAPNAKQGEPSAAATRLDSREAGSPRRPPRTPHSYTHTPALVHSHTRTRTPAHRSRTEAKPRSPTEPRSKHLPPKRGEHSPRIPQHVGNDPSDGLRLTHERDALPHRLGHEVRTPGIVRALQIAPGQHHLIRTLQHRRCILAFPRIGPRAPQHAHRLAGDGRRPIGLVTVRGQDALLHQRVHVRLLGREPHRPGPDADCAETDGRGEMPPGRDAPRRDHRNVARHAHDVRHDRERPHRARVPGRVIALRDDHVRAALDLTPRLARHADQADDLDSARPGLCEEEVGRAEAGGDHRDSLVEQRLDLPLRDLLVQPRPLVEGNRALGLGYVEVGVDRVGEGALDVGDLRVDLLGRARAGRRSRQHEIDTEGPVPGLFTDPRDVVRHLIRRAQRFAEHRIDPRPKRGHRHFAAVREADDGRFDLEQVAQARVQRIPRHERRCSLRTAAATPSGPSMYRLGAPSQAHSRPGRLCIDRLRPRRAREEEDTIVTISWVFLLGALIGLIFTVNAHAPQRRTGPLVIPSFFAGWLTAELPLHHIAWQLALTGVFVLAGALDSWPGEVGLVLCVVSWSGLLLVLPTANSARPVMEAALLAGLGRDYASSIHPTELRAMQAVQPPPRVPLNPFDFARPDVVSSKGIEYFPGGGERNKLDVYAPKDPVVNAPVLLQIHGGGWVIGNKREQALPLMHHMAAQGWICVSANYRLSPKATFPEHLVDLKRAIAWIRREIAGYGGDPNYLAVTGGSAGGHLASLVGLTANDPEYQPGFEDVDTRVDAVVPFYGVYDFTNAFGLQMGRGMDRFIGRVILKKKLARDPDAFRRASPMHRMHADAPPFFIIHGTCDGLAAVEEARHFAQLLRNTSESPVVYAELPGTQHAFEIFHSTRTSHAVQAVNRFLAWSHSRYEKRDD